MKRTLILPLILGLFGLAGCGHPPTRVSSLVATNLGEFLPPTAEKGQLFDYYQARGRSKWKRNWAGALDLSGVSWNDPRTATLVSPSHVVMAAHYVRPSDVAAMFHDREGRPHERYIVAVKKLSTVGDIAVGKLNLPLPPEVKPYALVTPAMASIGRPVLITDQTRTVSIHRISQIHGKILRYAYHPGLDATYRRNLITGDSGNPSFLLDGGELRLLGTHTTGGPGAGPFYGDPQVQAAIQEAMVELGN